MAIITLSQGEVTIVNDNLYNYLNQWDWCLNYNKARENKYAKRRVNDDYQMQMHVQIMQYVGKYEEGLIIDHKDRNGLNNQVENLRMVTHQQNIFNSKMQINNTSGYKGVNFVKRVQKWRAYISLNGKQFHLGYFTSPIDAALAHDKAALKYHGEYAHFNFE